jgi:hypothetical protein
MACGTTASTLKAGYSVEIRVNGAPLTGVNLTRHFNGRSPEAMTLSAHVLIQLNAGDVVTLHFIPQIRRKKYRIAASGARMNVKLEPWY